MGKQKFDECKTNFVSIRPNLLLRLPLCLYLSCSCFERKGEKMSACLCLVFLFFSIVAEATYSPGGFHHLSSLRLKKKTATKSSTRSTSSTTVSGEKVVPSLFTLEMKETSTGLLPTPVSCWILLPSSGLFLSSLNTGSMENQRHLGRSRISQLRHWVT